MKTMKLIARRGMLCLLAMLLILAVVPTFSLSSAAASGKTYYVAADGKDDNDGLSEDSPLSYFKAAYGTLYKGGDRVLFKRGDIFYGEFHPMISGTSNTSRVEIGAYGSGPLPIITLEKVISSAWTNAGNGFYKFVLTKDGNYTGVNNNVTNVGFMKDSKGNFYGRRFRTLAECTQQYDFYCDDTAIYVKSSKDPYAALGTLTLATHGIAVGMSKGMEIHDLHVRNSGQGFDWKAQDSTLEGKEFIHIYDCVIDGMGGTVGNEDKFTRLGNCINLWVGGSNVVIENNLMRNTWDVAFTPQGEEPSTWRNVVVQNNIITYCTQAIEVWCGATSAGTGVNGLKFINNLCIKNGEGWGSATRETQDCDVLTYGYYPDIWRMNIENNTFYHSDDGSSVYNIHPPAMEKFIKMVTVNNNQAYQLSENSNYLYNRANVGGPAEYAGLQLNFAEWKELTGKDSNSKITYIGNNAKYKTMEQVALTSIDFDEIAKAAKAAGLSFTLKYDASSKPTTTTTTTTTKAPSTTTATAIGKPSTTTTTATVSGTESSQPESEPSSDVDVSETTTQPNEPTDAPADDGGNGPSVWLYIGIGGGVLLVAAAVVVLLILKKKQGETQE